MRISLRIFLVVIFASSLAFAGDPEFRGVVNAIEGHYRVRHMHIPLLGVALFFARPEGVSGLKLAVFENFPGIDSTDDVRRIVETSLGPGWYPFVRVRSQLGRETTLVYTNPSDRKLRMMIVNVESSEATVVELKLSDHAIKQWLKEPGEEAEDQSGHRRHRGDN